MDNKELIEMKVQEIQTRFSSVGTRLKEQDDTYLIFHDLTLVGTIYDNGDIKFEKPLLLSWEEIVCFGELTRLINEENLLNCIKNK